MMEPSTEGFLSNVPVLARSGDDRHDWVYLIVVLGFTALSWLWKTITKGREDAAHRSRGEHARGEAETEEPTKSPWPTLAGEPSDEDVGEPWTPRAPEADAWGISTGEGDDASAPHPPLGRSVAQASARGEMPEQPAARDEPLGRSATYRRPIDQPPAGKSGVPMGEGPPPIPVGSRHVETVARPLPPGPTRLKTAARSVPPFVANQTGMPQASERDLLTVWRLRTIGEAPEHQMPGYDTTTAAGIGFLENSADGIADRSALMTTIRSSAYRSRLRQARGRRERLREAILWSEILGLPRGLSQFRDPPSTRMEP